MFTLLLRIYSTLPLANPCAIHIDIDRAQIAPRFRSHNRNAPGIVPPAGRHWPVGCQTSCPNMSRSYRYRRTDRIAGEKPAPDPGWLKTICKENQRFFLISVRILVRYDLGWKMWRRPILAVHLQNVPLGGMLKAPYQRSFEVTILWMVKRITRSQSKLSWSIAGNWLISTSSDGDAILIVHQVINVAIDLFKFKLIIKKCIRL